MTSSYAATATGPQIAAVNGPAIGGGCRHPAVPAA